MHLQILTTLYFLTSNVAMFPPSSWSKVSLPWATHPFRMIYTSSIHLSVQMKIKIYSKIKQDYQQEQQTFTKHLKPAYSILHLILRAFSHFLLQPLIKWKELQRLAHGLSWILLFFSPSSIVRPQYAYIYVWIGHHLLNKVGLDAMVDQIGKAGPLESWAQLLGNL